MKPLPCLAFLPLLAACEVPPDQPGAASGDLANIFERPEAQAPAPVPLPVTTFPVPVRRNRLPSSPASSLSSSSENGSPSS